MPQPPSDIDKVLESHRGQKHVVVLQNFPDPDAIASGFAHRLLSSLFEIETTLLYSGKISHPQNTALVNLLGRDLAPFESGFSFEGYSGPSSLTIKAPPLMKSCGPSRLLRFRL